MPSVLKFRMKVPRLRCDSHTSFKVKRSKVMVIDGRGHTVSVEPGGHTAVIIINHLYLHLLQQDAIYSAPKITKDFLRETFTWPDLTRSEYGKWPVTTIHIVGIYLIGKERSKNGEEASNADVWQREADDSQLLNATHRKKTRQTGGGGRCRLFIDQTAADVAVLCLWNWPRTVIATYRVSGTRYA